MADKTPTHQRGRAKQYVFSGLAVVLAFAFVELGVRLAEAISGYHTEYKIEDSPLFPDKESAKVLMKEYSDAEGKAVIPFSGGATEYRGRYVNVEKDGTRRGWQPDGMAGQRTNIYVIGGSTVFGLGARDDHTIPSYISRLLNIPPDAHVTYVVRNYGEGNYSLMQGAARLLNVLGTGEHPDLVIFYGGANDVSFVNELGVPGVEASQRYMTNILSQRIFATGWDRERQELSTFVRTHCKACQLGVTGLRSVFPGFLQNRFWTNVDLTEEQVSVLAEQSAEEYKQTLLPFLHGLATGFHFQEVIFWQPTLFTELTQVGVEKDLAKRDAEMNRKNTVDLYRRVNRLMSTDAANNFYNLSGALQDRTEACYLDSMHLSEACNAIVAQRIVAILQNRYLVRNEPSSRPAGDVGQ